MRQDDLRYSAGKAGNKCVAGIERHMLLCYSDDEAKAVRDPELVSPFEPRTGYGKLRISVNLTVDFGVI